MKEVSPLGILSLLESQTAYALRRDDMLSQVNGLDKSDRKLVATYLRKGSVVLAIMEYTTDILNAKFGTSGGSGILTDGKYFWRGDAADYVETYGISPGEDFILHVYEQEGEPTPLTNAEIIEVDDFLSSLRRDNSAERDR